jgi:selenocysteine lyase/cysteine desulfurase
MTVVERLGLSNEGLIRAGCACYTTVAEVERLVEGVKEIIHQNKAQAQDG